jgi:hypothetical protein
MKSKIVFKSFLPDISFSLEKNKPLNFSWFKKAYEDYKKNFASMTMHTIRCPGINGIIKTGWVQKTYQDIVITTNGDQKGFTWRSEFDQKNTKYGDVIGDYVHYHTPDQLDKFRPMNTHTLKTIVKIQSPWVVYVPKGYKLLSMPVAYNDTNAFTAATGFLHEGMEALNVQLYWHNLHGETLVKKGTPICQYILIKDLDTTEKFSMAGEKERKLLKEFKI